MKKRSVATMAAHEEPGPSGQDDGLSSVVYIGSICHPACSHVPHGFYEKQMKDYFSQFGKVLKVRLSRNKKTGRSKHYAFLEFSSPQVATIVADSMDGYFFFGQKLQCRAMRRSEVHPELFKGANRTFSRIPWRKLEMERQQKAEIAAESDPKRASMRAKSAEKRDKARLRRIADAGIEYEYQPGAAANPKIQQAQQPEGEGGKEKHTAKKQKRVGSVVEAEKKKEESTMRAGKATPATLEKKRMAAAGKGSLQTRGADDDQASLKYEEGLIATAAKLPRSGTKRRMTTRSQMESARGGGGDGDADADVAVKKKAAPKRAKAAVVGAKEQKEDAIVATKHTRASIAGGDEKGKPARSVQEKSASTARQRATAVKKGSEGEKRDGGASAAPELKKTKRAKRS